MRLRHAYLFILTALAIFNVQNGNAQQPETQVLFKTTAGDIRIKLYNDTPLHRDNFIKLVEDHYYDGLLFHRVIRDFMIQSGDPDSRTAQRHQQLGKGGPEYTIPAELVYPKHFHKRGSLSAARQSDQVNPERRSSGSQFYIVTGKTYRSYQLRDLEDELSSKQGQNIFNRLCGMERDTIISMTDRNDTEGIARLQEHLAAKADSILAAQGPFKLTEEQSNAYMSSGGAPWLDGEYTVFGEVVEGMKVVDKIEGAATDMNDRPLKDIKIISAEIVR